VLPLELSVENRVTRDDLSEARAALKALARYAFRVTREAAHAAVGLEELESVDSTR